MLCQVASTTWGPSGLLGPFVMTAGPNGAIYSALMYLIGLLISYVMSYVITRALISDKDVAGALGGITIESEVVRHGDIISFEFEEMISFEHIIRDPVGIHARPAGELAELVSSLGCDVTLKNGEKTASGKSVIGMMTLDASQGSRLEINVKGKNAKEASQSLMQYMDEKL